MRASCTGRAGVLAIGVVVMLAATACQSWSQFMGNPGLTGNGSGETTIGLDNVTTLAPAYTVALPGHSGVVISPVTGDGKLFAGTDDGHLVAASADAHTNCSGTPTVCQPLWTASLAGLDTASPPVVSDHVVYEAFSSSSSAVGVLAAYDTNGVTNCSGAPTTCQPLWVASVGSIAGVNVDHGTVFVEDTLASQLDAFDATASTGCSGAPTKTCVPRWTAAVHSVSVPAIANGRVYVPGNAGTPTVVAVFDEAGKAGCSGSPVVCHPMFTVPLPSGSSGSVAVTGSTGFVEIGNVLSTLVAFDATGSTGCSGSPVVCQPRWTAPISGFALFNTPAVAGGRVYAASEAATGGEVDVFDAAGITGCRGTPLVCSRLVTTPVAGDDRFASPEVTNGLLVEKNAIYPATDTSHCGGGTPILCAPLWSTPVTGNHSGSIVSYGTLFLGGDDGSIHAFQLRS